MMLDCNLCEVIDIFKKAEVPDYRAKQLAVRYHYVILAVQYKIVKRGARYCVTTEDGSRTLGCHSTRAEALKQLRAVEANK